LNKVVFPESVKYPVQYSPNILASAVYCKNHHFIPYERISELFSDVMGIKICSATIIKAERECFQNLKEFENMIRNKLITSPVIHFDETGIHDGWKPYNVYACDHALCNAHLQRELTGIGENYKQQWAKEMNDLLTDMKKYTDECTLKCHRSDWNWLR
jgi:transposase